MRPAVAVLVLLVLGLPPAAVRGDAAHGALPGAGTLDVSVTGVRSDDGTVRLKVVRSAEGFPGSDEGVVAKHRSRAARDGVRFRLHALPYGEYAVVAIHDEDDDAELDRGLLGIPTEGVAFSRGARIRFGPPPYEEARFELAAPVLELRLEMQYR